jgi:hypothetical protein
VKKKLNITFPIINGYILIFMASKITESKITESKITESKITESKITESKITESKITESKITESKITESKITESKQGVFIPNGVFQLILEYCDNRHIHIHKNRIKNILLENEKHFYNYYENGRYFYSKSINIALIDPCNFIENFWGPNDMEAYNQGSRVYKHFDGSDTSLDSYQSDSEDWFSSDSEE